MKRYINTIRYLKWIQIVYQLRYRIWGYRIPIINRGKFRSTCGQQFSIFIPEMDGEEAYIDRFKPDKILNGNITLLQHSYPFQKGCWNNERQSHLWNFNLHYFEFAAAMAVSYQKTNNIKYYDKFKELYIDWMQSNKIGKGDAWHPYTISLRLPNLLLIQELYRDALKDDLEFQLLFVKSIYKQYRFLCMNLEKHLLGNHYLENLNAIYLCSLFFAETQKRRRYEKKLIAALENQIGEDGMHYEGSFMYHHLILENILRIIVLLQKQEAEKSYFYAYLKKKLQSMYDCMFSLEKGMGKLPFFNDAGEGVAKNAQILTQTIQRIVPEFKPEQKTAFDTIGYYKLENEKIAVLFDAGKIGPDEIPGHGHCDALSFELSVMGKPLFVNSGTYQYQGRFRQYFRSTRAHNTLSINGCEQSECWGEHRVARRIYNVRAYQNKERREVIGQYYNYSGYRHTRQIALDTQSRIEVVDTVEAPPLHEVRGYLHIHPDFSCTMTDKKNQIYIYDTQQKKIAEIIFEKIDNLVLHTKDELSYYSSDFEVLQRGTAIESVWCEGVRKNKFTVMIDKS